MTIDRDHERGTTAPTAGDGGRPKAPFVLVPGPFAGGWLWRRVAPLLRAAGHEVVPVTLTGLGDRAHLAAPAVGLQTHVEDVVNVLLHGDISGAVLVGHSYGGMAVAGAADRVPERLARVVYLDAPVPEDGQSYCDLRPSLPSCSSPEPFLRVGDACARDVRAANPGLSAADASWFCGQATPHPWRTVVEPVQLTRAPGVAVPCTYVDCTLVGREPAYRERAQHDPSWGYRDLEAGSLPMLTVPDALARLLLDLAGAPGTTGTAT